MADGSLLQSLLKHSPQGTDTLLDCIPDCGVLPTSFSSKLRQCSQSFYKSEYHTSVSLCEPLLDYIWEHLNTGHWTDVPVSWRHAYSVVSLVKGLSCVGLTYHLCKSGATSSGLSAAKPNQFSHTENEAALTAHLTAINTPTGISSLQNKSDESKIQQPSQSKEGKKTSRENVDIFCNDCQALRQESVSALNHLKRAIKALDMGLLMGAPILGNVLTTLSGLVHKHSSELQETTQNSNTNSHTFPSPNSALCGIKMNTEGTNVSVYSEKRTSDTLEAAPIETKMPKLVGSLTHEKRDTPEYVITDNLAIPRVQCPSLESFHKDHFSSAVPVIITDAMSHWPAMSSHRWSVDYLRQLAGHRLVPIEIGSKYTDDSWTQKLMTIREFTNKFFSRESESDRRKGYLAQHQLFNQIPELQDDIIIPDYCYMGEQERDEEVDINAWFGPKGTLSPLHHDPKENFLCQVVGEKYVRLYSESQNDKLYPRDGLMSNTSQVDVENPDLKMFPLFEKAQFSECVLKPGEMLFIPKKCWHFVKSLSVSFSVSFWWH